MRRIARALIAKADVVVENFSGGVMKKYGLDYASVVASNPRLVYCSISAYGRKGEFALRPGFDPITQAESGFMSFNGFPVCIDGAGAPGARDVDLKGADVDVTVDLKLGDGHATIRTTDLSHAYVEENSAYSS